MTDETPTTGEIAQTLNQLASKLLQTGAIQCEQDITLYQQAKTYADTLNEESLTLSDSQQVGQLHTECGETMDLQGIGFTNDNTLSEGDSVRDTDPEDWMEKAGKNTFEVVEVTDIPARDYRYDGETTVAEVNPLEPASANVVEVTRDDMSGTLAYPRSRLSKIEQ